MPGKNASSCSLQIFCASQSCFRIYLSNLFQPTIAGSELKMLLFPAWPPSAQPWRRKKSRKSRLSTMRRTFWKHPGTGNFSYFNSLKVFCLFVSCSKDIWWYFGKQLKVLVNFGKKYPLKFFGHINRVHSVLRSRFSQIAVKTIVIFYLGSNTQTAICLIAFCYLDLESYL